MNNFLAWIGVLFVAVLTALFAVPAMIDWNGYRGIFEEEATRILGRDVRLGGNVNLRLLPTPYVSFERMRISDPGSQSGDPLFSADRFTMWLAISPLLRGVLQANQVELTKPFVKLAINKDGVGNWSTLQLTPGSLPFVPADVTLNSVRLTDGVISFVGPNGGELARGEAVNGEFAADAIRGPFKFRGNVKLSGQDREVRLATGAPEANGDIRFKVAVAGGGAHSSYVLDGRAIDFSGKPRFTGELTAKIAPNIDGSVAPQSEAPAQAPAPVKTKPAVTVQQPVAKQAAGSAATVGTDASLDAQVTPVVPAAVAGGAPLYDLRARLEGDAAGLQLKDINVTSAGTGPPQLMTGEAKWAWSDKTKLDVTLNSRWLDLDAVFGRSGKEAKPVVPLEAAREIFETMMRLLPETADTNAKLAVDQLNLGADQISNIKVTAVRAGGPLELQEFQVGLPGQTQLNLSGKLAPGETAPKFDGTVALKGQNLLRFLAWAVKRPSIKDGRNDGAFALNGKLNFSGKLIELTEAKVGVGEVPVTADVRLDLSQQRRLAINLEGQKIDLSRIWPGSLRVESLAPLLVKNNKAEDAEAAIGQWFDPANSDLMIGIKAGTLSDGTRVLRDVEADVSIERGQLAVRALRFGSQDGLEVDLEGQASALQLDAEGRVRGVISAPDAAAARSFVSLAGLTNYAPDLARRIESLAPLRMAGTLGLGKGNSGAAVVDLDGVVRGGGRLVARFELEGGLQNWRKAPIDAMARIDAPDVDQSLAALLDDPSQAAAETRKGRILLRAAGTPEAGVMAFAALESDGLMADYSGKATFQPEAAMALEGDIKIAARDVRALLSIAGLKLPTGAADIPAVGRVTVLKSGNDVVLKPTQLTIAGTALSGELKLSRQDAGPTRVSADLQGGDLTVVGLLSTLLDGKSIATAETQSEPSNRRDPAPTPGPVPEPVASIWPDQSFDFSALNTVEGSIGLQFKHLSLEPGLGIANAKLAIGLKPGRIEVMALEGDALGGKVNSKLTLEKVQASVTAQGELSIAVATDPAKAADVAHFVSKFSGRALSPSALMADLKGDGELKLGDVGLSGMSSAAVASISEAAMQGTGPQSGEPLLTALRDALKEGELKLGQITMPVTIADGSLKLAKVDLDRPDGRTTFETVVDLATLKIDSEWNIEARLPKSAGRASEKLLPPVSVVYAGKLKDITSIEPLVSVAALERELSVRKMERDVDELERLRKLDEQRAREEQERIKAEQERLKAERDKAAAAAAAAAAVDDPQPDPVPGADATVDQEALPPVDPAAKAIAPQNAAQDRAIPSAAPRPSPPKRRKPSEDNWNPFTNPF